MKKIITVILITIATAHMETKALDVTYKPYGSGHSMAVIVPTINNFIELSAMSESEFERTMQLYKYFENDNEGKYRSFWNGSLDNFAYANCVNTFSYNVMRDEIRFYVSRDMVYPQNAITELYRELRPYYKDSKINSQGYTVDLFAFKIDDAGYYFYITESDSLFDILMLKKYINE